MTDQQITDLMAQMIRVGFVNARQPEKMRVKVTIPDTTGQELITDFLPVLCPRACDDMQYDLPDVGDQVLCLFLSYGLEQGFVIGAMYGKQAPPVQSGDKWHRTFSDGATLAYDRASHELKADIPGTAHIKCSNSITLEAPIIYARGTFVNTAMDGSPGKSSFSGGMEVLNGGINVPDADIVASGVSLVSHTQEGVMSGNGTSSFPTGGSGSSPGTGVVPKPLPGTSAYTAAIASGLASAREKVNDLPESEIKEREKLILCLPEIAEAMARREEEKGNFIEAEGWKNLAEFFRKWLSTKVVLPEREPYDETQYDPEPLFIRWEWLKKYKKIQDVLNNLKKEIITPIFKRDFTANLKREGKLTNNNEYFNYIPDTLDDKSQFKIWDINYQQNISIKGDPWEYLINGLDAQIGSLGTFSLRVMPKGIVEPLPGGGHKIIISDIAIYAHDTFNFEDEAPLGWWDCETKKMYPKEGVLGTYLGNDDFRQFRWDTSYGGNFKIYSMPVLLENLQGISYETKL